eukprot:jgi/Botrbrau1/19413/Bobra.0338s0040.1
MGSCKQSYTRRRRETGRSLLLACHAQRAAWHALQTLKKQSGSKLTLALALALAIYFCTAGGPALAPSSKLLLRCPLPCMPIAIYVPCPLPFLMPIAIYVRCLLKFMSVGIYVPFPYYIYAYCFVRALPITIYAYCCKRALGHRGSRIGTARSHLPCPCRGLASPKHPPSKAAC